MKPRNSKIILLKKDGSHGGVFEIKKDLKFGSDHPANIRIKSSSIAKEHAIIQVHDDQNCYLLHISSSNPPKINGQKCGRDPIPLHDQDIITMGGRSFLFQAATSQSNESFTSINSEMSLTPVDSSTESIYPSLECAYLSICNRDGTERDPLPIIGDVIFGSEPPASIRIKSRSMEPIHAKISVIHSPSSPSHRQPSLSYSLIPLTPRNPPTVNGIAISGESGLLLSHNDSIEIGGRRFCFRLALHSKEREEDPPSIGTSQTDNKDSLLLLSHSQSQDQKENSLPTEIIQNTQERSQLPPLKMNELSSVLESEESPPLKPPPRPPTPPAIKFNTIALIGSTLTRSRTADRSIQKTSSLERDDNHGQRDRPISPYPLSSRIRPTNLIFNRGMESFDVSGSDCDQINETHEQESISSVNLPPTPPKIPSPNKSLNLSTPTRSTTTRPSSTFISPPSPYPCQYSRQDQQQENQQQELELQLEQRVVSCAHSHIDLLTYSPRHSPDNLESGSSLETKFIELNVIESDSNLPVEGAGVGSEAEIPPPPLDLPLRNSPIATDHVEELQTPLCPLSLPESVVSTNTDTHPSSSSSIPFIPSSSSVNEPSSMLLSSSSLSISPLPYGSPSSVRSPNEDLPQPSQTLNQSPQENINPPPPPLPPSNVPLSPSTPTPSNSMIPPSVPSHPIVITLNSSSSSTPPPLPPSSPSPPLSQPQSQQPPPRQGFLRSIFSPLTNTASSLSLRLLINPLLSLARDLGVGSSLSPHSSQTSQSTPLIGDIEQSLSFNREGGQEDEGQGEDEDKGETNITTTAVIPLRGIQSFFNLQIYFLKQAYGTFRSFFFFHK